jgi:hypothetical protein
LADKKNTVVPIYIGPQDLSLRSFNASRYFHLSNSQRDKELRAGRIEVLDLARKIYRVTAKQKFPTVDSRPTGDGSIFRGIPWKLQQVMASHMTQRPIAEPMEVA